MAHPCNRQPSIVNIDCLNNLPRHSLALPNPKAAKAHDAGRPSTSLLGPRQSFSIGPEPRALLKNLETTAQSKHAEEILREEEGKVRCASMPAHNAGVVVFVPPGRGCEVGKIVKEVIVEMYCT